MAQINVYIGREDGDLGERLAAAAAEFGISQNRIALEVIKGGLDFYVRMERSRQRAKDLTATTVLGRPGPMRFIPGYLAARARPVEDEVLARIAAPALAMTCGVVVFWDQAARLMMDVAGFSLGQTDVIRKAAAKGDDAVVADARAPFVAGAVANGVDAAYAGRFWDEVLAPGAKQAMRFGDAETYKVRRAAMEYIRDHYTDDLRGDIGEGEGFGHQAAVLVPGLVGSDGSLTADLGVLKADFLGLDEIFGGKTPRYDATNHLEMATELALKNIMAAVEGGAYVSDDTWAYAFAEAALFLEVVRNYGGMWGGRSRDEVVDAYKRVEVAHAWLDDAVFDRAMALAGFDPDDFREFEKHQYDI